MERGKKVKEILAGLGIKIKTIAPILGKDDHYIYSLLDREDLSWEIIRKIGEHIKYDFRKDFPEMPFEYKSAEDDEITSISEPSTIEEIAKKWKDKYYNLLEEHAELLRQKKSELEVA